MEDWARAQQRLDDQLRVDWPRLLDRIAGQLNPMHEEVFAEYPLRLLLVDTSERVGQRCGVPGSGHVAAATTAADAARDDGAGKHGGDALSREAHPAERRSAEAVQRGGGEQR